MKLVDLVIEVRFGDKTKLIKQDLRLALAKKIVGSSKNAPDFNPVEAMPGIELTQKEKRLKVVAEEYRYAVAVQHKNVKRAIAIANSYIETINSMIDYKNHSVVRIGIKTVWIEKTRLNTIDLANLYKSTFYKATTVLDEATDYAVNLTLKNDEYTSNYISGPVGPDEAQQYVTFPVGDLSPANAVVIIDAAKYNLPSLSVSEISQHMGKAAQYGQDKAAETFDLLGVNK